MSTYAALTDGTTTITFASPANGGLWYKIETGWGPRVAGLRQSQFGGRGPYDDVQEEIPVSVGGSNAAHMYANVSVLKGLLDNANRWYRNEGASATLFKYSPEGATISSAASPLQVATWGAELELPSGWPNIPASGGAVWSSGLTMRFTRKGEWLHNTQSASASGSNGSPVSFTFASAASFWSPTDVQITNSWTGTDVYNSLVLVSTSPGTIINVLAGSVATVSGNWNRTISGSAQFPISSSLARYNPADTNEGNTALATLIPLTSRKLYGIFVSAKNNSSTVNYKLRFSFGSVYCPYIYILAGASLPKYYNSIFLIPPYTDTNVLSIYATASVSAASTNNWLDIDNVVVYDSGLVSVLSINEQLYSSLQETVVIANSYLTKPMLDIYGAASSLLMSYSGNTQPLSGASAQGVLLGTYQSYWRQTSGSAASLVFSNTWTLTRTNAYLIPV